MGGGFCNESLVGGSRVHTDTRKVKRQDSLGPGRRAGSRSSIEETTSRRRRLNAAKAAAQPDDWRSEQEEAGRGQTVTRLGDTRGRGGGGAHPQPPSRAWSYRVVSTEASF